MYGVAFDKHTIECLIKDLAALIPGRISFFNTNFYEILGHDENKCTFCDILVDDKEALRKCKGCDENAFNIAQQTKSLYLYECHAGLTEGVIPIIHDEKILGYLMLGKMLTSPPDDKLWEKTYEICRNYNINFEELKEAFFKLKHMNLEKVQSAARIIDMCARFIHMTKLVRVQHFNLFEQIELLVDDNLDKSITISDISKYTNLSKSYLSNKFRSHFKVSFGQYVTGRKIEKAKLLLEQTDLAIKHIAEKTGYPDMNYFSRVFKKVTGQSPSEYRTICEEK